MIDIMPDDKDISKALNVLNSISDKLRYEKICEISEVQKNTYKKILIKSYLKNSNSFMTFPLQIMPLKIYIT